MYRFFCEVSSCHAWGGMPSAELFRKERGWEPLGAEVVLWRQVGQYSINVPISEELGFGL